LARYGRYDGRVDRFALLVALSACGSSTAPRRDDAAIVVVAIDAAPPPVDACVAPVSVKIENGACDKDADCVLTDLAVDCSACRLDRVYPTRKPAFDERVSRCASVTPATTGCGSACPPHDTYTGAFYRPECRAHRCIAWRYHGGG